MIPEQVANLYRRAPSFNLDERDPEKLALVTQALAVWLRSSSQSGWAGPPPQHGGDPLVVTVAHWAFLRYVRGTDLGKRRSGTS